MLRSGGSSGGSNSSEIFGKIDLVMPQLLTAGARMWQHPRLAEFFSEYLISLHTVIRATVHSLTIAGECASRRAKDDPVALALSEYYLKHAAEETDHDEWLLDDIQALGISRAQVWSRMPTPAAATLVGTQYYWAHHVNPVAYLGYIAVLEFPPGSPIDLYEEVIARAGLPREAFRTQFFHATLDKKHEEDFCELLDELPLKREHRTIIGVSAFISAYWLGRLHDEVVENFERRTVAHPTS